MASVIDCYKTGASDESVEQFGFECERESPVPQRRLFSLSTKEMKYSSSYGVKVRHYRNAAGG